MSGFFKFLGTKVGITMSSFATTAVVYSVLRDSARGKKIKHKLDGTGKVVIVTGANTGIGYETANGLAKRGARVYMACRNMKKCEEARADIIEETGNRNVHCRHCDLSSMESVREFAKRFKEEEQWLDVLVNNAAIMRCPRAMTVDRIEMHLGVNHIGHFLLTQLLLDLLKKSKPSRIVVVTCEAHQNGVINTTDLNSEKEYDKDAAYNQSKLANVLFTRELAKRLHRTGVVVNAVDPGYSDTELFRHMPVFKYGLSIIFKPLVWPFMRTALNGSQTVVYAALDPKVANTNGLYYKDLEKVKVPDAARDGEMGLWLWKASENWASLSATDVIGQINEKRNA